MERKNDYSNNQPLSVLLKIQTFTGGAVSTNGYLLQTEKTNVLIDTPSGVSSWLKEQNIAPDAVLLTHQHFDHVEDASLFQSLLYAFSQSSPDLIREKEAQLMGIPCEVHSYTIDNLLTEEKELTIGDLTFELRHLPGHSPDSLVYYLPSENTAIVGDTLFRGGIGRTDLPHGDHNALFDGIASQLMTLPPDTTLYPGHGPKTQPQLETGFEAWR